MPASLNIQVLSAQIFSGVSKDFSGRTKELRPYLPTFLPSFLINVLAHGLN